MMDGTQRFTSRVESYRRFRPRYPQAIVELLQRECGLRPDEVVADVAAGTGLLTEIFLAAGHPVFAVEPNDAMREACAALESHHPRLQCVAGTAEETGLPDHCASLVTVGQALHWLNHARARAEFARILNPGGCCAIVYNHRRRSGDIFHDGYERVLRDFGLDYEAVQREHPGPEKIAAFFAPSEVTTAILANEQELTLEGLKGRVLSSSYMPQAGQPGYEEMTAAIEALFFGCAREGTVRLDYETAVSWGRI